MIPLKIDTLLAGQIVEQDRVEYKEGWNPNDIIHTICAFANDYNNVNGGYLVIGVQADNGIPILPPKGLPVVELDVIQQEIFQYCNHILPRYIPKIEVVNYQGSGTYLLYLWCTAGDSGPYQAPMDVYPQKGKPSNKKMQYWIRPASLTTYARQDETAELFDKFNSVPFDDRVNRKATINHIRRGYVEDFLRDSNSTLADYPYNALEEAVVNAVFHKSYREPEPVEIRIYVDRIMIINYPGLAKWVNLDKFVQGKAKARKYRNRRIGELFKELDLSEKQGTGITKILKDLRKKAHRIRNLIWTKSRPIWKRRFSFAMDLNQRSK